MVGYRLAGDGQTLFYSLLVLVVFFFLIPVQVGGILLIFFYYKVNKITMIYLRQFLLGSHFEAITYF